MYSLKNDMNVKRSKGEILVFNVDAGTVFNIYGIKQKFGQLNFDNRLSKSTSPIF